MLLWASNLPSDQARVGWGGGCNGNDVVQCGSPGTSDGYLRGVYIGSPGGVTNLNSMVLGSRSDLDLGFRTFVDVGQPASQVKLTCPSAVTVSADSGQCSA